MGEFLHEAMQLENEKSVTRKLCELKQKSSWMIIGPQQTGKSKEVKNSERREANGKNITIGFNKTDNKWRWVEVNTNVHQF